MIVLPRAAGRVTPHIAVGQGLTTPMLPALVFLVSGDHAAAAGLLHDHDRELKIK